VHDVSAAPRYLGKGAPAVQVPTYSIKSVPMPEIRDAFLYDGPTVFGRLSSGKEVGNWVRVSRFGHVEWAIFSSHRTENGLVFFNRLFLFGPDSALRCIDAVYGYTLWDHPEKFVRLFSSYPYVVGQTESGQFIPIRFDTGISESLPKETLSSMVLSAPIDRTIQTKHFLNKMDSLAPRSAFNLLDKENFLDVLVVSQNYFAILTTHRLFLLAKPTPIL
jgi:hypothetical protein